MSARAYQNGVWLCSTHADQVDNDAERFPREMLVAWRVAAEPWARQAQGRDAAAALEGARTLLSLERRLEVDAHEVSTEVQRPLWDVGAQRAWEDCTTWRAWP
jgi:hypothetical protein